MFSLFIAIHAIAATGVVLLGPIQIIRRTKDRKHRFIGRSWVILMYFVCTSGMFIYSLTGSFTLFHALAIWIFISTTLSVIAIRRGNVRRHIGMMVGSYLGALIAGIFAAAVPGREIPQLAVSDPGLLWSLVAAVIVAVTAWAIFVLRFVSGHDRQQEIVESANIVGNAEEGASGEPLTPAKLSEAGPVTA
ncbi:DUF2306 domain-containing protein [Brevibacterium sediminis]|uniref:DUF2306 domain-containing protein n=1 Tax=Brevibacterium sediminis TaxID=1857024 RepID=UPI0021752B06|nr:DUF2306 domain-containing protein [Brevibacterium sediminis]MCS4593124.1 DUF2306 domain-containing protein [Brevibacterium sediminis]